MLCTPSATMPGVESSGRRVSWVELYLDEKLFTGGR
jgi:hypothetical protein